MSTAGTIGGTAGGFAGGAIGGIIGSFIPPPGLGTLLGRAIGSRVGRALGAATAEALNNYANSVETAEVEAEEEDEAVGVAAEDQVCNECAARCQQAASDTKNALYNNKRNPNNPDQGYHGYLNRMIEQMCGASGPGTPGWGTHIDQLRGSQNRLRDSYEPFQGEDGMDPDCDPSEFFSRAEREAINNILGGRNGWTPNTIPWKGPSHSDCQTLPAARDTGRIQDYLHIIRPQTSVSSGPFLS